MILPERKDLPLKVFMIACAGRGRTTWKFHNDALGIKVTHSRNSTTGESNDIWEMDRLPGQFSSYEELRKAAEGIK